MKSNNREYNIIHEEEKIIITKKFSKEAGQLGTAAYKTMMQLRLELPGYKFETKTIKKKKNKKSYRKFRNIHGKGNASHMNEKRMVCVRVHLLWVILARGGQKKRKIC